MLVELRDVTELDRASVVLASHELHAVPITPDGEVAFTLAAPAVAAGRSLSVRAQVDVAAGGHAGDYLTTVAVPVPVAGETTDLVVPLAKVR